MTAPAAPDGQHQFRVTVEDLVTGDRQVMAFAPGDYVLIPFEPCHRGGVQAFPATGTHVITVRGHRPSAPRSCTPAERATTRPAPVSELARILRMAADGVLGDAMAEPFRLTLYQASAIQLAQREGALDGATLTPLGGRLLGILTGGDRG